jgi:hypothetical protein
VPAFVLVNLEQVLIHTVAMPDVICLLACLPTSPLLMWVLLVVEVLPYQDLLLGHASTAATGLLPTGPSSCLWCITPIRYHLVHHCHDDYQACLHL